MALEQLYEQLSSYVRYSAADRLYDDPMTSWLARKLKQTDQIHLTSLFLLKQNHSQLSLIHPTASNLQLHGMKMTRKHNHVSSTGTLPKMGSASQVWWCFTMKQMVGSLCRSIMTSCLQSPSAWRKCPQQTLAASNLPQATASPGMRICHLSILMPALQERFTRFFGEVDKFICGTGEH